MAICHLKQKLVAPAYCFKIMLAPRAIMAIIKCVVRARGASLLCEKYSGAMSSDAMFNGIIMAGDGSLFCQKYSLAVIYGNI